MCEFLAGPVNRSERWAELQHAKSRQMPQVEIIDAAELWIACSWRLREMHRIARVTCESELELASYRLVAIYDAISLACPFPHAQFSCGKLCFSAKQSSLSKRQSSLCPGVQPSKGLGVHPPVLQKLNGCVVSHRTTKLKQSVAEVCPN